MRDEACEAGNIFPLTIIVPRESEVVGIKPNVGLGL